MRRSPRPATHASRCAKRSWSPRSVCYRSLQEKCPIRVHGDLLRREGQVREQNADIALHAIHAPCHASVRGTELDGQARKPEPPPRRGLDLRHIEAHPSNSLWPPCHIQLGVAGLPQPLAEKPFQIATCRVFHHMAEIVREGGRVTVTAVVLADAARSEERRVG